MARSQEKLPYCSTMHFERSRNLRVEPGVHQSFRSPSLSKLRPNAAVRRGHGLVKERTREKYKQCPQLFWFLKLECKVYHILMKTKMIGMDADKIVLVALKFHPILRMKIVNGICSG